MNQEIPDEFISIWKRTQQTPDAITTFCELWNIPGPGGTVRSSGDTGRFYEIERILGVGGRAIVYGAKEVKESSTGRTVTQVAIKMLRPDLADSSDVDATRVFAEIEMMLAVGECPRVIGVKDYGVDGETEIPFYTMRYLEDCCSLKDYVAKNGALTFGEAARLLGEVAVAVEKLHDKDIVHRDLKPANVLICQEGGRPSAYLADFSSAVRVNQARGFVGSVYNQPPEQLQSGAFTKQSDIYALGTILYEITSGHKPYEEGVDNHAKIREWITDPSRSPIPLGRHQRNVPKGLDHICTICMRHAPPDRYQSVRDLREDLQAFQANAPLPSMPHYRLRLIWKRGRFPTLFGLLFLTICFLIFQSPTPIPIADIEKDVQAATDEVISKLKTTYQTESVQANVKDLLSEENRHRLKKHLTALEKVEKDTRLTLLESKIKCLLAVDDPAILSDNDSVKLQKFLEELHQQLAREQQSASQKIEQLESDASIYVLAGQYWFSRGDWAKAISQLERYVDLIREVPANVMLLKGVAHANEGARFRREKDRSRAAEQFDKAFRIYQDYSLQGSVQVPIKMGKNGSPAGWLLHQREGNPNVQVVSGKSPFDREVNALSLKAKKSSYALYRLVTLPDPANYELHWEWKVDRMPENPNFEDWRNSGVAERPGENPPTRGRKEYLTNQPIQVIVGFYRVPKPVALQYSWDPTADVGTFYLDEEDPGEVVKLRTGGNIQVPTFILESGKARVGRWVSVQRDFTKDFQRVYPGQPVPGVALIAVQINSQFAKNTNDDVAESMIRSIRFVKKSGKK